MNTSFPNLLLALCLMLTVELHGQQVPTENCFPYLEILNDTLTQSVYKSSGRILSNSHVTDTVNVEFRAGSDISLTGGFTVDAGSMFSTIHEDCDNNVYPSLPLLFADRFGNIYKSPESENNRQTPICLPCGYFTLKFYDSNNKGFDHPSLGVARRETVCKVFNDLSSLIISPAGLGEVIINVEESTFNTSGTLATATAIHVLGTGIGLDDNGIWRTLQTGEDAWMHLDELGYTNEPHGSIQANFSLNRPYVYNHVNGSICLGNDDYDFYTIILHEAIHSLGVYSLIDVTNPDHFSYMINEGPYPYFYNRFDVNLFHSINPPPSNPLIDMASPFDIQADLGVPLNADCQSLSTSNDIHFTGSSTSAQSLWTGIVNNSWASSLSHLNCVQHPDYVMNPEYSKGTVQRNPHPNEVGVLEDLGYVLTGNFGATSNPPNTSCDFPDYIPNAQYSINPNQMCHIGLNDRYTGAVAGTQFVIRPNTITSSPNPGYLENDFDFGNSPTMSIDNLWWDPAIGTVTFDASTGIISFTPDIGFSGWAYILYVVECATGLQSNMTFITIEVSEPLLPDCISICSNTADILCWGDFEDFVPTTNMHNQTPTPYFTIQNNAGINMQNSTDICSNPTNQYANINSTHGEFIFLPFTQPVMPGCNVNVSYLAGFNAFTNAIATPRCMVFYVSETLPCPSDNELWDRITPVSPCDASVPSLIQNTDCLSFEPWLIHSEPFGNTVNQAGICTQNPTMLPGNFTYANNSGNPLNFLIVGGFVSNGFGKFDDIVVTNSCPPNIINVTPTPLESHICENGGSTIDFKICNDVSSPNPSDISFEAIPHAPVLQDINIVANLWFDQDGLGIPTLNLVPGACQTVTLEYNSTLQTGNTASIELALNHTNSCNSSSSITEVDIIVDDQIYINPTPQSLDLCINRNGEIDYEICNHNSVDITFNYNTSSSGPSAVTLTPAMGTLTVLAGECINHVVTVDHSSPLGAITTIKFEPNICVDELSELEVELSVVSCSYLDAIVFLDGVQKNFNSMTCEIEMQRYYTIPNDSPYPGLGYSQLGNYPDNCSWASNANEIIDWVFVELRDIANPSTILHARDALLLEDGRIIDTQANQGQNLPLAFHNVSPGDYHVVVRHRNQLDVMTDVFLSFSPGLTSYCNFSDGSQSTAHLKWIHFTDFFCPNVVKWVLYAGDVNQDGIINAADRSDVYNAVGQTGYISTDCILSDLIDEYDEDITWDNRNKISNVQ